MADTMQKNGNRRKDVKAHPPDGVDRKAFVLQALEQFEKKLTAYARRLCNGDLHAARDVVQHAFLQLCRQDPEKVRHKTGPWLYTVCRNRIFDESKSKRHRPVATPDDFDAADHKTTDPASQFEREDFLLYVRDQFKAFPPHEQEAIELWSHGFKSSEIADILKKKTGTVRVNLFRAMQRLKRNPEVKTWLERATGQVDRQNSQADEEDPASPHEAPASPHSASSAPVGNRSTV